MLRQSSVCNSYLPGSSVLPRDPQGSREAHEDCWNEMCPQLHKSCMAGRKWALAVLHKVFITRDLLTRTHFLEQFKLKARPSLTVFTQRLKTHLFNIAYCCKQ